MKASLRSHRARLGRAMRTTIALLAMAACPARPSLAGGDCAALPPVPLVTALDEDSRTTRSFDAERELRGFVLYSYRNLAGDLVDGHGPYLDALAYPFQNACGDREVLLEWFRRMLAAAGSATEFSRRMAVALATVRAAAIADEVARR